MKKINFRPQVRKTLVSAAAGATFLAFSAIPTLAGASSSVWNLAQNFTIEMVSTSTLAMPKVVDLSIESVDPKTGDFSGEGVSADNPNQVWEVTGTVVGTKLELSLENVNSSYRIVATGKVDEDGVLSGRAADELGELYEWEATDGAVVQTGS